MLVFLVRNKPMAVEKKHETAPICLASWFPFELMEEKQSTRNQLIVDCSCWWSKNHSAFTPQKKKHTHTWKIHKQRSSCPFGNPWMFYLASLHLLASPKNIILSNLSPKKTQRKIPRDNLQLKKSKDHEEKKWHVTSGILWSPFHLRRKSGTAIISMSEVLL